MDYLLSFIRPWLDQGSTYVTRKIVVWSLALLGGFLTTSSAIRLAAWAKRTALEVAQWLYQWVLAHVTLFWAIAKFGAYLVVSVAVAWFLVPRLEEHPELIDATAVEARRGLGLIWRGWLWASTGITGVAHNTMLLFSNSPAPAELEVITSSPPAIVVPKKERVSRHP